jgi:glutathione S-transferase
MKLFYSPASPFARKVAVVVAEHGLGERVRQVTAATTPLNPNADIARSNPLAKIPTLVLEDGSALYDSPVICEYLDQLSGAPRLFPAAGAARWTALRRQALGDGLLDAALLLRYETFMRPEPLRWADWINGQRGKMNAALDAMEAEVPSLGEGFDIGHITFASACGYLDLRFADMAWRNGRPALSAWFARVSERPSLKATVPSA